MRLHHRVPETVAFIIIVLHMTDRSLILTVNFHQKCNWWGEGRIISPFKVTWQKWGPLRASELSFRIWGAELQTPWGGGWHLLHNFVPCPCGQGTSGESRKGLRPGLCLLTYCYVYPFLHTYVKMPPFLISTSSCGLDFRSVT